MKCVSVIIPCFNQGSFIEECVVSVLKSSYSQIEIIVINDGSTDVYTNQILSSKKWPKTTIYTIENGGVSSARNYGIQKSSGNYILPLDADDKISSDYIEKAVEILEKKPNVKVVTCKVQLFGEKKGEFILPDYSIEVLMGQNTMVVSSLFRKIDYERTNGFDVNMSLGFEDWDFWLSLLQNGGEVVKLNFVGFYYRIKRRSRNSVISGDSYSMLRQQIYKNHRDLYSKYFLDPTKCFEYNLIINSKEYKLGSIFIKPLRGVRQYIYSLICRR